MPKKSRKPKTPNRFRLSDVVWERIEPLLPPRINPHPRGGGRKPVPNRDAMDAIFFVLRTGCQWNALNETGICTSSSAHRRFQEWTQAGVFKKLWSGGLEEYDELKGIQRRWQSMEPIATTSSWSKRRY